MSVLTQVVEQSTSNKHRARYISLTKYRIDKITLMNSLMLPYENKNINAKNINLLDHSDTRPFIFR